MRNKVLERPLPNHSLPRNGFDRGFEIKYNFSSGMALPVFCEPVLGNSKMRINRKCLLRASQLQTAAMVRNSFNVDFFFVPFRQLWSYYGALRTGTKDYYSSKMQLNANVSLENLPRFAARVGSSHHDLYTMLSALHDLSSTENNPDIHGYAADQGCARLLDLLNYGVNIDYILSSSSLADWMDSLPAMSPFKLLAYQKVWYDHYRLTNYVANNPLAYNVDNLINASGVTANFTTDQLVAMGTMHYVPYRKDYFQNIYPSLNYAPINQMASGSFFAVPNNVVGATFDYSFGSSSSYIRTNVLSNSDGISSSTTAQGIYQPLVSMKSNSVTNTGTAFTAQSIRALFALDKMTRLAAYAPKHVADQFEARFGFRPKGEDINESVRIGSFVSDISIGEVVSSANTEISSSAGTSGSKLGAIGARAFSVAGFEKDIEYTCPEDGIVIGIAYSLPRISYDSGGIDDFNMVIQGSQLPQPEFMDLGLQPLRQNELYHYSRSIGESYNLLALNNRILGYQPMYSSWKIGKDRNHGLFVYGGSLSPFSTHTRLEYTNPYPDHDLSVDGVSAKYFYSTPSDLNPIFANYFDGLQINDQFFGMLEFKFDVVQNLSIHGQPKI